MALNWLVKDIADQDFVWLNAEDFYKNELPKGVKPEDKFLNPKIESMIWATIPVGINKITTANYEQFYHRYLKWNYVCGYISKDKEPFFSLDDVRDAVGLSTNASNRTATQFNKLCADQLDSLIPALMHAWEKAAEEKLIEKEKESNE